MKLENYNSRPLIKIAIVVTFLFKKVISQFVFFCKKWGKIKVLGTILYAVRTYEE